MSPFILRRMKEAVLADLPPKIIQNRYCDLSPLQARLYARFARSAVAQQMEEAYKSGSAASVLAGGQHTFQALMYMRLLCSHPMLVSERTPCPRPPGA